jgi:hypothetical protein
VTGSVGIAGWIVLIVFWAVLAIGVSFDEVRPRTAAILVALWLAGRFGLPRLLPYGDAFVTPYVALLDLVLVLLVFKGDVRLN